MDNIKYILSEAIKGNDEKVVALITAFYPLIKKYSRQLNYEEAETDIIIRILEKLPKSTKCLDNDFHPGQIINYLRTLIERTAIDLLRIRIKHNRCTYFSLEDLDFMAHDDIDDSNTSFNSIISNLSEEEQDIIKLRYMNEFSDYEIAHRKKTSRQNICKKRKNALRKLAQHLERG